MRGSNPIQPLIFLLVGAVGLILASGLYVATGAPVVAALLFAFFAVVAWIAASAVRMVRQWESAVVLRLGKFRGLRGPGLFFIIPVVDSVAIVIDRRTITTPFKAEKTLTLDTVPVDVDA